MRLVALRGEVLAVRQRLAVRAAVRAWVDPVAAVAGLAVAAGGGGAVDKSAKKELQMKSRKMNSSVRNAFGRLSIAAAPCALGAALLFPFAIKANAFADFDTKP